MFAFTWTDQGQPATVTYPNGTTATYGYDEAGAPVSLAYANGGGELLEYSQVRDVDGRVVSSASNLGEQDYSYDDLGRLTMVEDTRGVFGGCQSRVYGFSVASERVWAGCGWWVSNRCG